MLMFMFMFMLMLIFMLIMLNKVISQSPNMYNNVGTAASASAVEERCPYL